jgi:hypothetical protein
MKNILFTLSLILIGFTTAFAQETTSKSIIEFDNTTHDFGTLKEEEEKAEHVFKFKNTTNQPIKLTSVRASCGCTTPKWTTDIIQPNQTGEVSTKYGTTGRPGAFTKSITVIAAKVNPQTGEVDSTSFDNKMLMIKGTVTPKPTAPTETVH